MLMQTIAYELELPKLIIHKTEASCSKQQMLRTLEELHELIRSKH